MRSITHIKPPCYTHDIVLSNVGMETLALIMGTAGVLFNLRETRQCFSNARITIPYRCGLFSEKYIKSTPKYMKSFPFYNVKPNSSLTLQITISPPVEH